MSGTTLNSTGIIQSYTVAATGTYDITAFGGQVFVLSAQGPGPLNCKILLDGNVVSDATATTGTPARTVCSH